MPASLIFRTGLIGEWRTVILALRIARGHLLAAVETMDDNDDHKNVLDDHLQRIEDILPRLEIELEEHLAEGEASVNPALFFPESQHVASAE